VLNLSLLYQEYKTKWGFHDGDLMPNGAYDTRDAIVKLINANLPKDCQVEAYGYDRPGMHNNALILYRKKGTTGYQEKEEPESEEIWDIFEKNDEQEKLVIYYSLEAEYTEDDLKLE
jgi:hypothetical protein